MRWIDQARQVAKEYRSNCLELAEFQKARAYAQQASGGTGRSGKIAKPVERAVEQIAEQERIHHLEKSIKAVDFALEMVALKPNGADTRKLFDMLYYHKSHTLKGAAYQIGIAEATAKRYNKYFLKIVAIGMGYYTFKKVDTF